MFPSTLPGWDIKVTRTPVWNTAIKYSQSGTERRLSRYSEPRYRYTLSLNFMRQEADVDEANELLGLFLVSFGSLGSFDFVDPYDGTTRTVRFDRDSLSINRLTSGTAHGGGQTWEAKTINLITVNA